MPALMVQRNSDGALDADTREEWRDRCKRDLKFLHKVLNLERDVNLICDRVHDPVFDFYFPIDPAKRLEDQTDIRAYLQLDPRGTFKTSIKNARRVQTMLAFPDARHLCIASRQDFANERVRGIGELFIRRRMKNPQGELFAPLFQELFDDFCMDKATDGFETKTQKLWFSIPCGNPYAHVGEVNQPTLMAGSGEASMSGWHFEFDDEDDLVDNRNATTPETIRNINKNVSINRKMLMAWGIRETSGTRYHPFDRYGMDIEAGTPSTLKVLVRAAIRRLDGRRLTPGLFPRREECWLLWPEVLSYEKLREMFFDDYDAFMTQMTNDAFGANKVVFTHELLRERTRPEAEGPYLGERVVVWRLPYTGKKWMHAAGVSGTVKDGRLFVNEVVRSVFTPSMLAHEIVQMAKRAGERLVNVEASPGAEHIEAAILNYALVLGWPVQVVWSEFEEDDGVRKQRIEALEPMLVAGRVLFLDSIVPLNELYRQMANFGMIEDNEVPDVVSRAAQRLPRLIAAESDEQQREAWALVKSRQHYDRIHGLGQFAPPEPDAEEEYREPSYGELGGLRG